MKKIAILLLLSCCMLSCKRKKQDIILGKWKAVAMENHDMDSLMTAQQMFIDTVGKNSDAATNLATYGVTNMDSFKQDLQMQLDTVKAMQQAAMRNSEFNFMKGGNALVNFGGGSIDSCKWYFDDEGALILDEMGMKGAGDKIRMEVLALNDTMMKLQLNEEGSKSTVTFKPKK